MTAPEGPAEPDLRTYRVVAEITDLAVPALDKVQRVDNYLSYLGGVTVSVEQVALGDAGVETQTESLVPDVILDEERLLHEQLSGSISEALADTSQGYKFRVRTQRRLAAENITTLRDLMVIGSVGTGERHQIAGDSLEMLDEALKRKLGADMEWPANPTATDAAQWCSRLDQVPTLALHWFRGIKSNPFRSLSVAQLTFVPLRDVARGLHGRDTGGEVTERDLAAARDVLLEANLYKREFERARQQRLEQAAE
jgi:hypothetical protein